MADIQHTFDHRESRMRNEMILNAVLVTCTTVLCTLTTLWYISAISKMTHSMTDVALKMHAKGVELTGEKRKTESLLFEILPVDVARKCLCI